jgi:CHAT domain-containing protein
MSLWVEPYSQRTSELLDFYKNKQAGLNQAESLRKAELLALAKDPSPWTWAAFQLLGPGY